MIEQHEPWPPYCCVAAFAHAALRQLGASCPPRQELARLLDTHVPESSANPWSLPIAPNRELTGVMPITATCAINDLLKELAPNLRMRHIPFRSIAMQLYADLADDAVRNGVVTGVGLDWTTILGEEGEIHRHLLRLQCAGDRNATLVDDSDGVGAKSFRLAWDAIERGVNVVNDGFWLIGPVEKLSFDIAAPWTAAEAS